MQIHCCAAVWEDFDELDPKKLRLFQCQANTVLKQQCFVILTFTYNYVFLLCIKHTTLALLKYLLSCVILCSPGVLTQVSNSVFFFKL